MRTKEISADAIHNILDITNNTSVSEIVISKNDLVELVRMIKEEFKEVIDEKCEVISRQAAALSPILKCNQQSTSWYIDCAHAVLESQQIYWSEETLDSK